MIQVKKSNNIKRPSGVFFSEELLPKSGGNVFRLVRMAAIRALELSEGKPPLINNSFSDKSTTIALEEISQGKISYAGKKASKKKEEEDPLELAASVTG